MNKDTQVVESILSELLEDVFESYRSRLSNSSVVNKDQNDPYSRARQALNKMSTEERQAIFNFIKLAMVDTSSLIFGTIDGSHFPKNIDGDFSLEYKKDEIQGSLQDALIAKAEELGVYN
ncbi:hypothetical protein EBB56_13495 [Halomonas sp. YLB-10]|uniref:hypothetical protein n=1 Tax=Halomonas sp. YLB-10 TaxID=2483111 RepID=UPI000F5EE109|nr:hypothetical protein [Halomonas sp. YLB-10]RQW70352.1 hypothetical protein EBB56_13495 [Halomonas sp. YLB-10]